MRIFILFFITIFLSSCSSTKKVYLCGDRECVNKKEAEQFFEENLTLEVLFTDKKKTKSIDLVKLNTDTIKYNVKEKRKKAFFKLSNKEKKAIQKQVKLKEKKIKSEIKKKNKEEKIKLSKKKSKPESEKQSNILDNLFKKNKSNNVVKKKDNKINNSINKVVKKDEICSIIDKCDIDQISEYLIKKGNNKEFPDLSK